MATRSWIPSLAIDLDPFVAVGGPQPVEDPAAEPPARQLERRATFASGTAGDTDDDLSVGIGTGVVGRAATPPSGTDALRRRRRPAQVEDRTCPATRRAWTTEQRADVHQGVGPVGRPIGRHDRVGQRLKVASREGLRTRGPTARPSTRRTFVSTAPTGRPKAMAASARAVYGPTPGRRSSSATSVGNPASQLARAHDPGGTLQVQRPTVVAESPPGAQDVRRGGPCERRHRREPVNERLPGRSPARDLGLLQDGLGDEHQVGIVGPTERQGATAARRTRPGRRRGTGRCRRRPGPSWRRWPRAPAPGAVVAELSPGHRTARSPGPSPFDQPTHPEVRGP